MPIRVKVLANGDELTSGKVVLTVAPCGGGSSLDVLLAWDGSRWAGKLDTSWLAGAGCYSATLSVDGHAAGTFQMDVRGGAPAADATRKTTRRDTPSTDAAALLRARTPRRAFVRRLVASIGA